MDSQIFTTHITEVMQDSSVIRCAIDPTLKPTDRGKICVLNGPVAVFLTEQEYKTFIYPVTQHTLDMNPPDYLCEIVCMDTHEVIGSYGKYGNAIKEQTEGKQYKMEHLPFVFNKCAHYDENVACIEHHLFYNYDADRLIVIDGDYLKIAKNVIYTQGENQKESFMLDLRDENQELYAVICGIDVEAAGTKDCMKKIARTWCEDEASKLEKHKKEWQWHYGW